jgi:phospholipase C
MQVRGKRLAVLVSVAGVAAALTVASVSLASPASPKAAHANALTPPKTVAASVYRDDDTATPIKHLVVIFGENVSFDHYFGTYPVAANTDGTPFYAKPHTPQVNGLTPALLTSNPNTPFNPERLTSSEALTCDQNHSYGPEQEAVDNGAMDKFVTYTDHDTCTGQPILYGAPGLGLDYFDGNTVTGLWNYAQNYSMSDNNFGTDYGPSTPGALNVISGNDGGGYAVSPSVPYASISTATPKDPDPGSVGSLDSSGVGTIYGDLDPAYDDCSDNSHTVANPVGVMTGQNIGDLLNARHITWGWFQGGFAPTTTAANSSTGYAICGATHENIGGVAAADYSPHHDPFQYYASTANPQHLPPSSIYAVGRTDQANHQYDTSVFTQALAAGVMPAVSYIKAPEYQDGHAGYSDPLDEQTFDINTINAIEHSKFWPSTAIIITYDDSDGWYDHVTPPVVNGSDDSTVDTALCTSAAVTIGTRNDRCGYGMRMPFIVISPWSRTNYVSHTLINQASVVKFIENNWLRGERIGGGSFDAISGNLDGPGGLLDFLQFPHLIPVILDPATGAVVSPAWDTTPEVKSLDSSRATKA